MLIEFPKPVNEIQHRQIAGAILCQEGNNPA